MTLRQFILCMFTLAAAACDVDPPSPGTRRGEASPGMHYIGSITRDGTPDVFVLRDDERGVTCWVKTDTGGIFCIRDGG